MKGEVANQKASFLLLLVNMVVSGFGALQVFSSANILTSYWFTEMAIMSARIWVQLAKFSFISGQNKKKEKM